LGTLPHMAATHKTRTIVYFDPVEREALEKLSTKTGAPIGELVRRAVAEWLKKTKKGKK
jgi:Ribbon-helix-helix domain